MTSRKPPPRSTVPAPSRRQEPPKRRDTVEVELEWLEDEPKSPSRKRPPPLPNSRVQAPPMPVARSKPPPAPRASKPPQRKTMEVDVRELIVVPRLPAMNLLRPTRPVGKPIPREEEDDGPRPESKAKVERKGKEGRRG